MKKNFRCKHTIKWHLRNILMMILASFISTFGYLVFMSCNDLLASGIWGVAAIVNHYLPMIPMAVYIVLLNAPLLILSWKRLQPRFAVYTVFVVILQSVLLLAFDGIFPEYTNNKLLACIVGGLLTGIGSGIIVKFYSSEGGTEVIGVLLKDKFDLGVAVVSSIMNMIVVLCAAFIFGFEPAMYTLVSMFLAMLAFNRILEGFNTRRDVHIITEKGDDMAAALIRTVGRGVTKMQGEGAYSHRKKDVLYCVVSRLELASLKETIQEVDEHAFVVINETYDIMGFYPNLSLKESNEKKRKSLWHMNDEDDQES